MGTLNFVLGTEAMDHQQVLIDQLADQVQAAPSEDQFFYLVPNHIKFETEIDVLAGLRRRAGIDGSGRFASERVQVLSFSRLAWFLMRDQPAFQRPRLSEIGMAMLVSKVVQEHEDDLHLYASEVHQPGFIQKLRDQLTELQTANISPDEFQDIISRVINEHADVNRAWIAKMQDVALIYQAYQQQLQKHFLSNGELYHQLAAYLADNPATKHMHFFLDRFTQFTASEQEVVTALILHGAATTVSLNLDRGYPDQNHPNASELPPLNDLFYSAAMQYRRLWKMAQAHPAQVQLVDNVIFADQPRVSTSLRQVDRYFQRYARGPLTDKVGETLQDPHQVTFSTMTNRRAELNAVATKIRQLVASGRYRYRDFLILSRHLDAYQTMIEPVFAAHQIPVFDDHERRMDQHPLVLLLTSLFDLPEHNYQLADVMQVLKTWLLMPRDASGDLMPVSQFQEAVFATENWCLKHGIKGKSDWQTTNPDKVKQLWQAHDDNPRHQEDPSSAVNVLNRQLLMVKDYVRTQLIPLFDRLHAATDGRALATVLFNFLQQAGVTERLYRWQQYQSTRNLDLAQRPQQVWDTFCQILQEYVDILGDESILEGQNNTELKTFSELLQSGFAAAQYSQIPATLDQVVISETGIVQSLNKKVVFMIGSTDDVMPEIQDSEGLITDQDKALIDDYLDHDYQYLPADANQELANEPFVNYSGMLTGQERLVMTAPLATNDDQELSPSPYLTDMANYFHQAVTFYPLATSKSGLAHSGLFLSAPQASLGQMVQVGRQARDRAIQAHQKEQLPPSWHLLATELVKLAAQPDQAKLQQRLTLVSRGFNYANKVDSLGRELAEALYLRSARDRNEQRVLYASISQLQDFYTNQYEYFLKYGLRLQKRDQLAMSNDRVGTFFHKAMETFINQVVDNQIELSGLSDHQEQLQQLIKQALATASESQPDLARLAAGSSQAAFQYQQLQNIVTTMIKILCKQAQYTGLRPFKTEAQFGRINGPDRVNLQPLDYPLAHGNRIYLRGRIDRIDRLATSSPAQDFLTVVDYKSGDQRFDLTSAYYGISLQLLTYLNGLQANLPQLDVPSAQLAGALYLHLADPKFNWNRNQKKTLDELELAAHQYKGILLDQPTLLDQLDHSIQEQQSVLYPLRVTKNGSISARKDALLVNDQQLQWLQEHNRQLIINAGNQILSGDLHLNPYRLIAGSSRKTGLDYSDFLDVYQFDNMLDQSRYRQLNPQTAEDEFKQAGHTDHDQKGE